MWRRTAAVTCSLASVPVMFGGVHAAEGSPDEQGPQDTIRAAQLPLYGQPRLPEYQYIGEEVGQLRTQISVVRKGVWKIVDSLKAPTEKVKDTYGIGKVHMIDSLTYIQEEKTVIPKATFIVFSSMAGGLIGMRKGTLMRQCVYAAGGMGAGALVCYPNQPLEYWRNNRRKFVATPLEFIKPGLSERFFGDEYTTKKSATVKVPAQAPPVTSSSPQEDKSALEDHGMSNPEDKDMYSTRKS